ncbi:hypothetical protein [Caenispirillum bisanense]|uniref:hypothetical protein n=1 Tax=Caenispirillum bisanense TaxID=414052 RepID=UPI0031D629F9
MSWVVCVVMGEDRDYNDVFESLVRLEAHGALPGVEHIEGFIAYGIYKHEKRQWLIDFRSRTGREPTEDEYREHARTYGAARRETLQTSARAILRNYQLAAVEKNRRWMREAITLYAKEARDPWRRGFIQSLAASFVFTLLLAAAAFILVAPPADLLRWVREAVG